MKVKRRWLCWLLLPLTVLAGIPEDYANRWPLALSQPNAGAYRLPLRRDVYQSLHEITLQDLVVINAQGKPVATEIVAPDAALVRKGARVDLPWFALPATDDPTKQDVAAISEIASDGSLRRVEMRASRSAEGQASSGFVLDASRVKSPISSLWVFWENESAFDRGYRVDASDDLRQWTTLQSDVHLVQLQNETQKITKHAIPLHATRARYLRLLPLKPQSEPLRLKQVQAELVAQSAAASWQWEALRGERMNTRGKIAFDYVLDGRFPIEVADVQVPENSTQTWSLQGRETADQPWREVTSPWVAYRVQGDKQSQSPAQALNQMSRMRYWRLVAPEGFEGAAPILRLGYRPEVVVFLAEGEAPFALLAGSARASRAPTVLSQLIDVLRQQRGADWQPAPADLGERQVSAGALALKPMPKKIDWTNGLLWGVLVLGAGLVAGFALATLRQTKTTG